MRIEGADLGELLIAALIWLRKFIKESPSSTETPFHANAPQAPIEALAGRSLVRRTNSPKETGGGFHHQYNRHPRQRGQLGHLKRVKVCQTRRSDDTLVVRVYSNQKRITNMDPKPPGRDRGLSRQRIRRR